MNWAPPPPQANVSLPSPPPQLEPRREDTLACGGGGGGPNSDDWTETLVLYIFYAVNAKPTPLDYVIGVYLVIFSRFLLVSAASLWFPLDGQMCNFYAGIFDHWLILRWLGLVRHQRQATQLLSLFKYAPRVISKTRRVILPLNTRNFFFFLYKTGGASEKFKNRLCPFLRPRPPVHCCGIFKNLFRDPVPLNINFWLGC